MNVASLELCKELYELSGWEDTDCQHLLQPTGLRFDVPDKQGSQPSHAVGREWTVGKDNPVSPWAASERYPAYDLGYLLRKLEDFDVRLHYANTWRLWSVFAHDSKGEDHDAPEDAAAKLAIELFKQDVLTKEVR